MLKKCDFCSEYNPNSRRCTASFVGCSACQTAARAFANYANTLARGRNTHTKNVNVNKSTSYHHKKR